MSKTSTKATTSTPTSASKKRIRENEIFTPEKKLSKATKPSAAKTPPVKKQATTKSSVKKDPIQREQPILPSLKINSFDTSKAVSECMAGWTFVFSGILENLSREESIDLVKTLGGRVTGAVSGKTNYLVVGETLEDGRPYAEGTKYQKALELKNISIVKGAEELYGLCKLYDDQAREKGGLPPMATNEAPTESQSSSIEHSQATVDTSTSHQDSQSTTSKAIISNPYAKKAPSNPYAKKVLSNPYATADTQKKNSYTKDSAPSSTSAVSLTGPSGCPIDCSSLWADKYAPRDTREILGNGESVKKLATWLNKWEHTFNNPIAHGKTYSAPGGPWKAALLSGPPGIGKTTTATLVAKEAGRDILEFNASDVRSKKAMADSMGDVTGSQVLNFQLKGNKKASIKLRCIIMDEVDGMGAGDRSGMSELIHMIKKSMVPIICICNDRQSQKMKSLLPYCMDLRYRRPTKQVIARRAVKVGESEGMRIEQNAAEAIAESCGNDIRQVLNCMQMWSNKKQSGGGLTMTYKDVKERGSQINKDEILRVSLFDATKMIVEGPRGLAGADPSTVLDNFYKRNNAFFVDYSLIGLNVHQNYLKVMISQHNEAKLGGDDDVLKFLERMHDATETMSDYAVAEQAIRGGDMNWGLLPFSGMLAVKTGFHAGGEKGGFLPGFPEFSAWMGKNSSRGRKNRLLQELAYHMNYKISGGITELRLNYLPLLRDRFVTLLFDEDGSRTTEAIELMDEYGLDRDDVFETLEEFKMLQSSKSFASLDSKQKAAFTREYNKGSHRSQALVTEQGTGKVTRKKDLKEKSPADLDAVDDDALESESDEEEGEEVDTEKLQAMFKGKGKGGANNKKAKNEGVGSKKTKVKN